MAKDCTRLLKMKAEIAHERRTQNYDRAQRLDARAEFLFYGVVPNDISEIEAKVATLRKSLAEAKKEPNNFKKVATLEDEIKTTNRPAEDFYFGRF